MTTEADRYRAVMDEQRAKAEAREPNAKAIQIVIAMWHLAGFRKLLGQ